MRGHVGKNGNLIQDDFFTVLMKDSDQNKGLRKSIESNGMMTVIVNSDSELNNFISYLKTDFARFCLSFYKINGNNHRGELAAIPWLDFNEKWNDEKLFKKFEVSEELQKYIREFLPDYYGIRK